MCPCWLPIDKVTMDQGWCASAFLFRVDEGRSARVDLSDCAVAVAMDFPGPTLGDGNATARVYVDDRANAAQRGELEAIFQGKRGGGMKGLGSLVTKWLPTHATTISVEETKGDLVANVGSMGTIRSKRLRNEQGRIVRLHSVTLGASPIDVSPSATEWQDPAMPRTFRTESGGVGKISWKG
jgi:hypothetical protein